MLDIFTSYHHMQFQVKLMIQTQEYDKKALVGPDLGLLNLNSKKFRKFYLY